MEHPQQVDILLCIGHVEPLTMPQTQLALASHVAERCDAIAG
jgi:hypothetical protein